MHTNLRSSRYDARPARPGPQPNRSGPDPRATTDSARVLPPRRRRGRNSSGGVQSTNIPLLVGWIRTVNGENAATSISLCVLFRKATAHHSGFRELKCLSGCYKTWALRGARLGGEHWLVLNVHQPKPRRNCWYQTAPWACEAVILRKHTSLFALTYLDNFICNMDSHVLWGIL